MNAEIKVVKSDGNKVVIDLEKIHKMVEKSCRGITGVSESLVEMNSGLQFYDGITTKDIQSILIYAVGVEDKPLIVGYATVAGIAILFIIMFKRNIQRTLYE